jgi:biopolymer transport protein ExbD
MTPMIDVVFLLIVFFLVSSHLARQESQMPLPLPKAQTGTEEAMDDSPRVNLNILRTGEIRLAGRTVQVQQLGQRLQYELTRLGRKLEVRIRSDRHTPYRFVGPVLSTCAEVGVWNVNFAVVRGE